MAGANLPIRFTAETMRTIAAASISGAYMGIGTAFANPIRQFKIDNQTDALLVFSFDGVNDHFIVPSNGFFLNDISSNTALGNGFFLSQGDRIYVKELGTPTTGAVYVSVFYGAY